MVTAKSGFGSRLKEVRGNISQHEFAKKIGTTQQNLSNYEKEASEPTLRFLVNISYATGVRDHWLLTGEGPKTIAEGHRLYVDAETERLFPEKAELLKFLDQKGIETREQLERLFAAFESLKRSHEALVEGLGKGTLIYESKSRARFVNEEQLDVKKNKK